MGRFIKRLILCVVTVLCVGAFEGCSRKQDADFSAYLNNTLEYFINDTGFEVAMVEEGSYSNEDQGIQVTIQDNLIQSIGITKAVSGYSVEGIQIGDKKKRVDKLIGDAYTAEPEITQDEELQTKSYAYQKGNRLFTITYNNENLVQALSIEVTAYTVGSVVSESSGESQISKDEIMVTVGNIDVSYSEAMIYLRTAQKIYETEFGNEVWGFDVYGNGTTIGSVLKQEVLDQIIQLEVINMVANEDGIALNDDEMLEVRNSASDFMKNISENDRLKYGITEELAVKVFATNLVAKKLYETVTIDVDTEVTDEEAQQCKIQKIFIKTYGMDSKGNRTELRDSELAEIRERVETLHAQALETTDFYSLAESNSDEDTIEYVVGRGELDEKEEEVAFSLKDGEVSDIIQNEDGYVIIYCVDSYDEDATLQVKEEIIEQRRSDLFVELYSEWYSKYEVKVNMNLWNKLELAPLEEVDKE